MSLQVTLGRTLGVASPQGGAGGFFWGRDVCFQTLWEFPGRDAQTRVKEKFLPHKWGARPPALHCPAEGALSQCLEQMVSLNLGDSLGRK